MRRIDLLVFDRAPSRRATVGDAAVHVFELMNQDGTKVYTSGKKGVGQLDSADVCVGCNETPPPTYLVRVYPEDAAQHFSAGRPHVLRILTSP